MRPEAYALAWHGIERSAIESYHQHYAAVNPYFRPIGAAFQPGFVGNGQMLVDDATVLGSEYYNDFMKPQDFYQMGGGPLQHDPEATSMLTLIGSHRRDVFGADDLEFIASLMPQMKAALKAMRRMRELRQQRDSLSAAIESVGFGLAIVAADGRVLVLNRAAQRITERRDGLTLEKGKLVERSGALERALGLAVRGERRRATSLRVAGAAERWYGVTVAPLRECDPLHQVERGRAVVMITDPETERLRDRTALEQAFRLTPAESRLLQLLLTGESVECAADLLQVSLPTARTHVRSLFHKFGVRRQGELVRKALLALPATDEGERD